MKKKPAHSRKEVIITADKYCGIMRIEKRKRPATGGIQRENNRTEEQHKKEHLELSGSDIDWERTKNNIWLKEDDNWSRTISDKIKKVEAQTQKKTRSDAVVMLDTVYTASNEFFSDKFLYDGENPETAVLTEEGLNYFKDCYNFYVNEFCQGDESKVINAVIHLDETTPHMHITSVPILTSEIGDRLNAKLIIGGRVDLRQHQDRFYEKVSSEYGLERGEVRDYTETKAHTTKQEWQKAKNKAELEYQEDFISRNNEIINKQVENMSSNYKQILDQGDTLDENSKELQKQEDEIERNREKLSQQKNEMENRPGMKQLLRIANLESENDKLKKENTKLKNFITKIRSIIENDHSKVSEKIKDLFRSNEPVKKSDRIHQKDDKSR